MPTTLPNGVVIDDLKVGAGKVCPKGAVVTVHYKGMLTSGTVFDQSKDEDGEGDPIEFPLGDLIEGWQHGIPGMKVGGKRRLNIPWKLAYGERGSPPAIPPKADLVFEIELLDVM